MVYKKYKITEKNEYLDYIEFKLNGYVRFDNKNHNFVCCINKYPFKTFKEGDEVEINLTAIKDMRNAYTYIDNQEIVRKVSKNYVGGYYDDYILSQGGGEEQKPPYFISDQKQKTAHQLKLALGNLRFMLEPLEGFIEKAYNDVYPNFRSKRQLYGKTIKGDYPLENFEETFLTQLLIMAGVCKGEPEFFRNEIKKEYYKWISAVGIDINNCPDKLKHFLFEINEVLEDRGEKILEEKEARIKDVKFDPKDALGLFRDLQNPLNKNREEREDYKGKNWDELGNENRFNVSDEQGKKGREAFQQIHQEIAPKQDSFYFYPQNQQLVSSSSTPPGSLPSDKVDKIATGIDRFGRAKKQEIMLIRHGARLNDYDHEGKLNFNNNPIYKWNSFKVLQKFEMKNALSENRIYLDKAYLTDDEISFVIKELADNPSVWRIEPIQGRECLIHSSAQGNNNREIGTLIHSKEKFSEVEWAEVVGVLELNKQYGIVLRKLKGEISPEYGETREGLEIWAKELEKKLLINNIRKNADEWEIREEFNEGEKNKVLIRKTAKISVDEDYDLTGRLINRSNEFYDLDYFDNKEQAEINAIFVVSTSVNQQLIDNIKQNMRLERGLCVINKETGERSENEDWLIHNSLERNFDYKTGYLNYVPNFMIKIKDLTEAEKQSIGYKSEQGLQTSSVPTTSQNDNKGLGSGGVLAIIGAVSILAIGSVVIVKKNLRKKLKK